MSGSNRRHPVLTVILSLLLAIILVVGGYVAYVFIAYYRLNDKIVLDIEKNYKYSESIKPYVKTGETYSIVTWNMGFGAYSDDYSFFMDGGKYSRAFSKEAAITNINAMTDELANMNLDFIFIQEVDTNSTRSYHVNEKDIINGTLAEYVSVFAQNYDSPYLFYPFLSPHGKSVSGILTESRYNIEDAIRRQLPIETGITKLVDLDRCYSVSRVPVYGGKTLCLYNFHLSAYTTDGTIATEQLKMLVSDIEKEYKAGNYVVCGGDFNKDLLGNSEEIFGVEIGNATWAQPIPEGTIPEWLTVVACSNAPSCRNADRPYDETDFVLTIDGFLVSDNIEVVTASVIDYQFKHSDHNPVSMEFVLK